MAKTVKCAFCGKEMVSGFFKGEDKVATLADEYISCCEDCFRHYELDNRNEECRFAVKVENYKKTNKIRKLSQQQILALYQTYFSQLQICRSKSANAGPMDSLGYFHANDAGWFCTTEFRLGSVISARDMAKAVDKLEDAPVCAFCADDIGCLTYRVVDKLGTDTGKTLTSAYLFEIRLNDPREMTYRPAVCYMVGTGTAFLNHKRLEAAEASVVSTLRVLKDATGAAVQITKVK
jgi:hypothetical protein